MYPRGRMPGGEVIYLNGEGAMSERLFKFLLSELKTIRVHCQVPGCGVVIEVPVDQLDQKFGTMRCPVCQQQLYAPTERGENPFVSLASAMRLFRSDATRAQIEFVLPDGDKQPAKP